MTSFDIVGSKEKAVALVEIPDEEEKREKEIAEEIMRNHKSVKSVLKKTSAREGEFRTREYKLLAGDKNTEVLHKEHGYVLKLDPQKVYFSVREGTERQRIARQVKAGETVMLMFAGIGAYGIAFVKTQPKVEKVIAVEMNSYAVDYMEYNIRVNKMSHKIVPVLGDVRTACEKWYRKCDRIVMPLPLGAESFLDIAVKCAKPGATVHFYSWGSEDSLYAAAEKAIEESLKKVNVEYKITSRRVVLPYSPKKYKVCVEFKVIKN